MEIKPKQITWDQIPEGWMVQPKYDGECNKLIIKDGKASLQRFEGHSKTLFYPEIIEYAEKLKLPDMVLVGEVCILMNELVASFPHIQLRMNTQNKAKQELAMKDKLATFMAFDIEEIQKGIFTGGFEKAHGRMRTDRTYEGNLNEVPYGERYSIMQFSTQQTHPKVTWKNGQPSARIMSVTNITSGGHDWKSFVKEYEMEGIVVKNPDKPTEWVKLKNWDEDDFKIIGTETTEAGEARGWFISKLRLEDTKGKHVDKGMQFDCKYINYPQTKQAKKDVIGKTAIIKYMKMRGRDGQYLAPRHPSLVEIMEFEK
jgi:ATP-dependent DNA ligase